MAKKEKNYLRLSRSKLDIFLSCPRCFYMNERLGVGRVEGLPFTLNVAVDENLKTEFDYFRRRKERHPIMPEDMIPFDHPELDTWRSNFKGASVEIGKTFDGKPIFFFGAFDDLWFHIPTQSVVLVDYKATSKKGEVTDLYTSYKLQANSYAYLLEKLGFKVYPKAFFVYENGIKGEHFFSKIEKDSLKLNKINEEIYGVLRFRHKLLSFDLNTTEIEGQLKEMVNCYNGDNLPEMGRALNFTGTEMEDCKYCSYVKEYQAAVEKKKSIKK